MTVVLISLLVILAVVVTITAWLVFRLVVQHGQVLMRLEGLEQQIAGGAVSHPTEPETESANGHVAEGSADVLDAHVEGLAPGTLAPGFRLPKIDGSEISLEKYAGKRLLLLFSDPHCEPCDRLLPRLQEAYNRDRSVDVVVVSRGDARTNQLKVDEFGLTFPIALQRRWEVSREYGMVAAPIAFLIDDHGIIVENVAVGEEAILDLFAGATARREIGGGAY